MSTFPQLKHSIMLLCLDVARTAVSTSSPNPQYQLLARPPTQAYETPLYGCNGEYGEVNKGNYLVQLKSGYTLVEHCRFIGKGGKSPTGLHVNSDLLMRDEEIAVGYMADATSKEDLQAVRADVGVVQVNCLSTKAPWPS